MRNLTKEHVAERDKLCDALDIAQSDLTNAITEYNKIVNDSWNDVKEAMDKYNTSLSNLKEWTQTRHGEMESYYEDRSDQWKEGDNGRAYEDWMSQFEEFDPEDAQIDAPPDLDDPVVEDYADVVRDLPDGP